MAISRRLPQSDEARDKALTQAKVKNDSIPVANQFLTAPTKTRLNASQPLFRVAMQNRGNALAAQAGATTGVYDAFAKTKMFISHFIQVFNLGCYGLLLVVIVIFECALPSVFSNKIGYFCSYFGSCWVCHCYTACYNTGCVAGLYALPP